MNEDRKLNGGCMCGQVRYEVAGEPFAVNYCHCESCRRHNGSVVAVLAGFLHHQVTFSGRLRNTYSSSQGVLRAFCGNCGTPLTWEGDGGEELGQIIELHLNTFDQPEALVPTAHAFEPERMAWFDVADDLPRFEGFADLSPLMHRGPAK